MADVEDPRSRIDRLLAAAEAGFRQRFIEAVAVVRDENTLKELATLLEGGRFEEALLKVDEAAAHVAAGYSVTFVGAADDTAKFLADQLRVLVNFDRTNVPALELIRQNQLRMVQQFTDEQRLATRTALLEGMARGLNPRSQAELFRDSIGLTQTQVRAVLNYRRLLEENSAEALTRELRDARSDRSIEAALRNGEPLPAGQIDRMVERYRQNYIDYRAEVIARTEALPAVHEGVDAMYEQAVSSGILARGDLVQTWLTAEDARVRDSHATMEGQQRPFGQAFTSGKGNHLLYPGDPQAPIADRAQCRCAKTTRFAVDAAP